MTFKQNTTTTLSVHDRALGAYVRSREGDLIRCVGLHSQWVQRSWLTIRSAVTVRDKFFVELILARINVDVHLVSPQSKAAAPTDSTVEAIVSLFDAELRYRVPNDQWEAEGRAYFAAKVRFFVRHNLTLELCLPAFPCKSSNPDKVIGVLPDRGEEIALRQLHAFARNVKKVYPPGARISIISDGHVFSDCIGVDDKTVDEYGERLKELNHAISLELGQPNELVQFQSLVDLFDLKSLPDFASLGRMKLPDLPHYLPTILDDVAELCRHILVAGCQPSRESLRSQIESGDESIVALYRGFSRFMLEDLDQHPLTESRSRTQRKKLASRVSFEMILRNQAYSNLIELLFPDYLRLSIHAHNNSGPKFGIRLFDTATVRAVRELGFVDGNNGNEEDEDVMTASHLLHIPTPWHNCIAQVAGDPTLYIVKYGVVKEASFTQRYKSDMVKGHLANGRGAFVSLKRSAVPFGTM
ncbi:Pyoverdine/dityrosine biosynthesis protein-domain-containing protein [Aspergillus alliaceus]|uniref:Pyoverdine/dityrosine biosynthesis protein-domain-containing protein n=1 Tax=Petromyces alliaceus TaxID=209559 RepID=A0A5N7CIY0_PETAA|nr:Pyoverdine/dityrosine biosynthesis protein-domain-containing protein [Aspergillus alliaceus]